MTRVDYWKTIRAQKQRNPQPDAPKPDIKQAPGAPSLEDYAVADEGSAQGAHAPGGAFSGKPEFESPIPKRRNTWSTIQLEGNEIGSSPFGSRVFLIQNVQVIKIYR